MLPAVPAPVVVGADIGGTSSRIAAIDGAGHLLGLARATGANPHSSGAGATARLAAAIAEAVSAEATVLAATFGMAGSTGEHRTVATRTATEAWLASGRPAPTHGITVVTDIEIAFAAGTDDADGVLLLSGTGALAARFTDHELIERIDGMGWLLGDEGSGLWLALEGLRAAARELDRRGPATALTPHALTWSADHGREQSDPRQQLVAAVAAQSASPARLGGFARTVTREAAAGDPVATGIVEAAAAALVRDFDVVAGSTSPTTVLAGSLLTSDTPVRAAVRAALATRAGTITDAAHPIVGALHLAARTAAQAAGAHAASAESATGSWRLGRDRIRRALTEREASPCA